MMITLKGTIFESKIHNKLFKEHTGILYYMI
jgi:hypothetical protein